MKPASEPTPLTKDTPQHEQLFVLLRDFAYEVAKQTSAWKDIHRESQAPWEGLSPENMSSHRKYMKEFESLLEQERQKVKEEIERVKQQVVKQLLKVAIDFGADQYINNDEGKDLEDVIREKVSSL